MKQSTAGHSYFITPMVNMMSNDDNCFVCGKKGHIGHHCFQALCCNYNDFGHFVQDCPEKKFQSGAPYHQNRSEATFGGRQWWDITGGTSKPFGYPGQPHTTGVLDGHHLECLCLLEGS